MPQVQNAVTAYQVKHEGLLPPTEGQATAVNFSLGQDHYVQKAEVLDICSIVGKSAEAMLRIVPAGPMGTAGDVGTNFYTGNCTRSTEEDSHYVFFVDTMGNVYTGCDCNENGRIEEDGMENVSQYSGNCSPDSKAGADVWPDIESSASWWPLPVFPIIIVGVFVIPSFVAVVIYIKRRRKQQMAEPNEP